MRQLSGLDASFLYMETATSFGHVSGLSIFTPPDDDYRPYEAVRRQLESRLDGLAPFRRRLAPTPLDLDHPYWINDPHFDLDYHVRHAAVPPPGTFDELADVVAHLISRPLDRSRPLWESYVLEGLESGDFALLTKVHHAAVDGAAGVELTGLIYDDSPDAVAEIDERTTFRPEPVPTQLEMFGRAMVGLARKPGRVARLQLAALRELGQVTRSEGISRVAVSARHSLAPVLNVLPGGRRPDGHDQVDAVPDTPAPPTPFNKSITARRGFALRSVPLQDVKDVKAALGVTVNDVVMAMCAGGLRTWLDRHDEIPPVPLVAMVPVSIRSGDEEDPWTNRVSSVFPSLPTHLADPLARVAAVHEAMDEVKANFELLPAALIADLAELSPPMLARRAARLAARVHIGDRMNPPFNVVISNVPGPRAPLYVGGATLKHYFPVSTVIEGQGLNITVQSYCDTLDIGVVTCRTLISDPSEVVDLMAEELAVLQGVAEGLGASSAKKTAAKRKTAAKKKPAKKGAGTKKAAAANDGPARKKAPARKKPPRRTVAKRPEAVRASA